VNIAENVLYIQLPHSHSTLHCSLYGNLIFARTCVD